MERMMANRDKGKSGLFGEGEWEWNQKHCSWTRRVLMRHNGVKA